MPDRREGESRADFLDRCMGDSESVSKYPDPAQRYAVCNSMADKEPVEALQYGKPGKNDPRKTPAKPSERRKGSKKNPPGSAEKPNEGIKVSEETKARLQSLMQKHNSAGKGSKASMGMLLTVYRRGAGAFSRSHHPSMSRGGWGVARVKAFLYLLRNGRPSNPNYKQDNDLLPKGHPRKSASATEGENMNDATAAEYQGKKVSLNKPFRTPKGPKKFAVYVENESGRVIIVRFGDPNAEIKRDDPGRRKNFRSRHNCDNPGPKTKARYWSCKMWERSKSVTDYTSDEDENVFEPLLYDEWMSNEGEDLEEYAEFYDEYDDVVEATHDEPCCDSCAEHAAKEVGKDTYDNPGEAAGRAKDLGCEGFHRNDDGGFMPCSSHGEYMKKVGDKAEASTSPCGEGEELIGGECVRVAVTLDLDIEEVTTRVEAATGRTYIRIAGVAFHEGINKNGWGIRPGLAQTLAEQRMIGSDVTLNHPKAEMGRFRRNMDGGVDEAVVGTVTEASYHKDDDDKYTVRYVAEVHREELFASLESGLWLKKDYGVSIGGTGIPSEVLEADEQYPRGQMWFAEDFDFDHLAIVHKPAYDRANIEDVARVEPKEASDETLKYGSTGGTHQTEQVSDMTDDTPIDSTASELEALRAELVLREARIAEFEAAEMARAEEARMGLVARATELGLKGHEDFAAETLTTMIASWEAAHPEPAPVEMAPAVPAAEAPVEAATASASEPFVASFFNGVKTKTPESIYARCYNSWVNAYNTVYAGSGDVKAVRYEDLPKNN